MEKKVRQLMKELNLKETQNLLNTFEETNHIDKKYKDDIKEKVNEKVGQGNTKKPVVNIKEEDVIKYNKAKKKHNFKWQQYAASIAIAFTFLLAIYNSDTIVQGFNRLFNFIPGVGIVEEDQELLYILKAPSVLENDEVKASITTAIATKDTMTISLDVTRKNITEEEALKEKEKQWEELLRTNELKEENITLRTNNKSFEISQWHSSGSVLDTKVTFFVEMDEDNVNTSHTYTIDYEAYDISLDFQLMDIDQYQDLEMLGPTDVYNNISLTAVATKDEDQLQVNVYPINHSKYRLKSFDVEYDLEYFNQKLTLETETGNKTYTLPGSYGSGMNATYTFDVSDGSSEYNLNIPFVLVESDEKEKISLPIPEEGEIIDLNETLSFENNDLIISSVEREINEEGFGYGYLKINLDYNNYDDNQRLVWVQFTRNQSEGWSEEYDSDGRLIAIQYALEKSDKNRLRMDVVQPNYLLMNEYNLQLNH
ncbi:hypothetical protein EDC19_1406 [Natranaerovirga hydrolytica]|uniref:DUF4179 domain-containing protein n=1 Tax=Natranaerovirga hydrolytica TaxID=680378 RepID=A0A4R1ML41_9FIRM|nr:hypothetical protein [Natranaerovirga hydrolytica]TCK93215.1 hypothetical protein EDC19_1406 [Natranaerovirga hydrolytica]